MATKNERPERESKFPKCFGKMFREDGRLTYGAMICDECENVEECWKHSKSRGK